ncbi:inactive ubiquitin carboxyl-terminal hydrolase MINDY-4B isoform X1 [Hylaeus anthracinus]|uniref:inactive ubiquitin carboxyl-terminal hydrolase MINDY-4B isoform X1 n=1 Tax=Hylaeus anthracinus TaxID=313031 RepID=UPI0023B95CB8|nr:inactive ubiquitin carboxyl-terminal hydrolase MINDY-4B isoform X1 [Hylaeus anthracinus]
MEEPEETEEGTNSSSKTATVSSACGKRHCTEMRAEKPVYLRQKEKIIYPRNTRTLTKTAVIGGKPIDEETCMTLRGLVFGSAATPPKPEWARTGLTLRPYGQTLAFGLRSPRNTTRGLVTAVQAIMLKHFLFKCNRQETHTNPESLLKPSYDRQIDVLTAAIAEIIWRCAGGFVVQNTGCSPNQSVAGNANVPRAVVALPQETPYLQHSVQYFQDGLTETLHLFEFDSLDDLQIFIKRYLYLFQDEGGPGAQLLLYSAMLSRNLSKIRADLEDPRASILSGCPEEGPTSVVMLSLTGRASPHLHNGVLHVGDENTYAIPQWGVLVRSEIGFLVHEGDGQTTKQPGSRLKTPSLPIWVTLCHGHHGVLFNTNRELLRNYHAERLFDVQYFTCGGSHATLTVDTRSNSANDSEFEGSSKECMDIAATPLEKLIRSKWQDAYVQWNGTPLM